MCDQSILVALSAQLGTAQGLDGSLEGMWVEMVMWVGGEWMSVALNSNGCHICQKKHAMDDEEGKPECTAALSPQSALRVCVAVSDATPENRHQPAAHSPMGGNGCAHSLEG